MLQILSRTRFIWIFAKSKQIIRSYKTIQSLPSRPTSEAKKGRKRFYKKDENYEPIPPPSGYVGSMNDRDNSEELNYEGMLSNPEYIENYVERKEGKIRKAILFKKIQKKHFPEQREQCLLTWAAKEQMRYLNKLNPEVWTPEKLAQSFPVSPTGAEKLLSSRFVPKSPEKLERHDKAVLDRWKLLEGEEAGPIPGAIKEIAQKMSPHIIPTLPSPTEIRIGNPLQQQGPANADKRPGKFASIVYNYQKLLSSKENEESESQDESELNYEKQRRERRKYDPYSREDDTVSATYVEGHEPIRGLHMRASTKLALEERDQKMRFRQADEDDDEELHSEYKKWVQHQSKVNESALQHKNMSKHEVERRQRENVEFQSVAKKYRNFQVDDASGEEIKWDNPTRYKMDKKEAYMYNSKLGYERPFGRVSDEMEERIEIPQEARREGASLYKRGDSYYTESGEFLYRVPGMTIDDHN